MKKLWIVLIILLLIVGMVPALFMAAPRRQVLPGWRAAGNPTATPLPTANPPATPVPAGATLPAGPVPAFNASKFVRFTEFPDGSAYLDAAIVEYVNPAGQHVSLVSAVHVADADYFRQLQEKFRSYEVVLYELIMPRGATPPSPGHYRSRSGLSWIQLFMRDKLKMEFQLDGIDYRADNFVHADMSVEDFQRLQQERGESMLGLMFRSAMSEMKRKKDPNEPPPLSLGEVLMAGKSPDPSREYRLILGRQFASLDRQLAGMEGPNGSVILSERNKTALAALDQTLALGHKNIAIYFGAGHMIGIEKGLFERHFQPVGVQWLHAWTVTPTPTTQPDLSNAAPSR